MAAGLFLASVVIAIVGIATAVRPVDEQRGSGSDGWPIALISSQTPADGCTEYVSGTIGCVGPKRA